MAIKVEWDTEERLALRYTYPSEWNWKDFEEANMLAWRLIEQCSSSVCEIIELPDRFAIPDDIFSHLRHIGSQRHPRSVTLVVVGLPPIAESLYQTFSRIYPHLARGYWLANSLPEARLIVQERLKEHAA